MTHSPTQIHEDAHKNTDKHTRTNHTPKYIQAKLTHPHTHIQNHTDIHTYKSSIPALFDFFTHELDKPVECG